MTASVERWPVSVCTSERCRKPILWTFTQKGDRLCVDAAPNPAGNTILHVVDGELRSDSAAHAITQDTLDGLGPSDRYMPHWATCADPQRFRKKAIL